MNYGTAIGLEFGSTRIKSVLIDRNYQSIASGSFEWENHLVDGIWTYDQDEIIKGLQVCYRNLKEDYRKRTGKVLKGTDSIGISGMMHGYLPFDSEMNLLERFRTWRNTITGPAAAYLTDLFGFNIPQRWSVAHICQAVMNEEKSVGKVAFFTTLAGYIHYVLTGEKVLGIGEASGMFPIADSYPDYDSTMLDKFDTFLSEKGISWKIRDILPKVLVAGESAGCLTAEGAALLDPEGDLEAGIPFAPPEGDAGTGMAATNSVRVRTGNVSAGTSDFAMVVVDHALGVHREIDMVTTPAGKPVAMVHCNNCTSDINAWVDLFDDVLKAAGCQIDKGKLYTIVFESALKGDADCGGLLSYNYISGEGVTDIDEGRPVFVRKPDSQITLANFARNLILSSLSTLKIGMDILIETEKVEIDRLYGHGGLFKTKGVGARLLSAATSTPVSVMETAGEGGPYGMALLASYLVWNDGKQSLEDYLDTRVFRDARTETVMADRDDIDGFTRYLDSYRKAFILERKAIEVF